MKKFFNKNNKGFTLVELIVVIAVIAVISIMVAPRFIEYVEKSRRGTDRNAVKELAHAVQVGYVTIRTSSPDDKELLLTISDDGNATYSKPASFPGTRATEKETLLDVVKNIIAEDSYVYKSKMYKGSEITFIVDDEGNVTISATAEVDKEQNRHNLVQGTKSDVEKTMDDAKARLDKLEQDLIDAKNLDVKEYAKDKIKEYDEIGYDKLNIIQKGIYSACETVRDNKFGAGYAAQKIKDFAVGEAQGTYDKYHDEYQKAYDDAKAAFDEYQKELDAKQAVIDEKYKVAGELQEHIDEFDK